MSSASDFIIENGVLKKYVGPGGDVVIPDGVTEIGDHAFCTVESIGGREHFWFNDTLTRVTLPEGLVKIGNGAFDQCVLLTQIVFPESLREIGAQAFHSSGLVDVKIPSGVKKIGDEAFCALGIFKIVDGEVWASEEGRERLHTIKICGTPKMGKRVFGIIDGLQEYIDGNLKVQIEMADDIPLLPLVLSWTDFSPYQKEHLFLFMLREPERFRRADIKYVAANVKKGQKTLYPELLKELGAAETALFLELNMVDAENADTVLELVKDRPSEKAVFLDYIAKHVTLEARENVIEKKAENQVEKIIKRNKAIEEAISLFAKKKPADVKKEWAVTEVEDGLRIEQYKGKDVCIVVPAMIGKVGVVEIANDALRASALGGTKNAYQKKMYKNKCVVIQEGVHKIGDYVLFGCVYLTDIVIPASVTEIGTGAFRDCRKLTIHAHAGSYAEQYAKENNIPFVAE